MATNTKPKSKRTAKAAIKSTAKTQRSSAASRSTNRSVGATLRSHFSLKRPIYQPKTTFGALLGELVGTFVLAAVWLNVNGSAIAILFVLTALTLIGFQLSGSHFNPAISIAMWITRQMSAVKMLGYVVAQVLGAMLALLVVTALLPIQPAQQSLTGAPPEAVVYTLPAMPDGKEWHIFFAQMLGTAVFAFAFASAYFGRKDQAATSLVVGLGFYTSLILVTASTYAVLNPAVAVSLTAIKWEVWPLAVYIASPVIGAIVGMGLYKLLQNDAAALDGQTAASK